MMLTYAAQMRGLLADHDTPTGLIWEMWVEMIKQAPNIVPQPQPAAPPPFTAYAQDLPERHDGERAFRFYLIFNLHPDELSHRTVRDGLLHIGGADITDVSRALGFGNFAWWVTVEPTQREDITIRLPVRDCTDTASVCADGRPLSEGLSRTVLGPDSSVTSMPNTPAAGGPVIEGSPVVGETLTAATTGIIDADGMTGAVFAFKRGFARLNGRVRRDLVATRRGLLRRAGSCERNRLRDG